MSGVRISEWVKQFNVTITPADGKPGETIYRLKDLFTTRDGSWDPSSKPGSVPQWARDAYLKPMSHPQYNDDGGADHHLFGAIALGDKLQPHGSIKYWTFRDDGNYTKQRVKLHGWANIVMWSSSSFAPDRGERGPWAWQPDGVKADIVFGGGMPSNWHVSFFAVWEPFTIPMPPVEPEPPPILPPVDGDRLTTLEAEVKRLQTNIDAIWSKLDDWSGGN